ncbi:alpha/beta fold hydrolase [Rossellomorea aquimaris]|uniref:Pimeloyl-ACP methyl ester carboxylesterase n=1 Tax=Rossellomorea aquimaris TaxID=189382 RepID=A0A366ER63_9BACI|nr:alpha/beta hydrolase [Rossellomorea aquimaris]RBP04426.1 pimeloyl-ACP methyl ester carboxylesterase [Rossellomorea aquimaris]
MSIHHKVIGEGFPIVMIHGWTLDHQAMLHAMEPNFENRSGWKRIYIDLPGMGLSEPQPSIKNSDDMLEAVVGLLDELIPDQPFIVCGYSYGGYVARGIVEARHDKICGLMLLAPMIIPDSDKRELPEQVVLKKDPSLLSDLSSEEADAFSSMGVVLGKTEWERFRDDILLPSSQTNAEFVNMIRENGYGFTFELSEKLDYPTLIVTGRQDHVVGYQDAWQLIEYYPRATFAVLDMAGHNVQIEQVDVFNSLVHNWLDKLETEIIVHS